MEGCSRFPQHREKICNLIHCDNNTPEASENVSENVEHFRAQMSRVEALGQSRSKSSFPQIGREAMIG